MASPRATRGPGPVAAVHRILIASALACALVYAAWEARAWTRDGAVGAAVRAVAALVVAGGVAAYYRGLRGLDAKLAPRAGDDDRR